MLPEEVALIHALYRTSVNARRDLGKALLHNKPVIDMEKIYDSRVAQFFDILLESLGFEITFIDSDVELEELDNTEMHEYTFPNGKSIVCTEYEKYLIDRHNEIAQELLNEYGILSKDELNEMIEEEIKDRQYLIGPWDGDEDFFKNCIEIKPHIISAKSAEEIMDEVELMNVEVDLDD